MNCIGPVRVCSSDLDSRLRGNDTVLFSELLNKNMSHPERPSSELNLGLAGRGMSITQGRSASLFY